MKEQEFTPPSAESLNLPSALPAGNPTFAPASVGMPSMRLDDSVPESQGALGDMFDWARKIRVLAAVRTGYDNNVNSTQSNQVASLFSNLNGGVNYRFGTPRLNFNADLTGGITRYAASSSSQQLQGTVGLGLAVEYRFSPRVILTFNTSTSYQQQPNVSLAGTANNSNNGYYYSANSLSWAYQWTELFTTVSRFNYVYNYYLDNSNQLGFTQPGFTQSFRWMVKPTTTAVVDYNTDIYQYAHQGNNSWGQYLAAGFDHIFNPKWFWNTRLGAQYRTSQSSSTGTSNYLAPYFDNSLSWQHGDGSSINWVIHFGTQPSGQENISFAPALSSGLNCTQRIFTKLNFNLGMFYLLTNYKDVPNGPNATIDYYQTNVQGSLGLTYQLNRIIQLALGYQYLTSISPAVPAQEYNRGISYFQIQGGF